MNEEDFTDIQGIVDSEGFDYAFRYYSSFSEIEDENFHKLRSAYIDAADALANYIGVE